MLLVILLFCLPTVALAQDLAAQKAAYLALLERYASGDQEGAARATLALDARQTREVARLVVEDVDEKITRLRRLSAEIRRPDAPTEGFLNEFRRERLRVLRLSLLVHTEAALRVRIPHDQLRIARNAVVRLESLKDDYVRNGPTGDGSAGPARASAGDDEFARLRGIIRDWYLVVVSHLFAVRAHDLLKTYIPVGLEAFKDDPELLLARGSFWEHNAVTMLVDQSLAREIYVSGILTDWRQRLGWAESDYEKALRQRPGLHEARLRWGRVNAVRGKSQEASQAFAAVTSSDAPAFVRYLARVFAGELAEERGEPARAREQYEAALGLYPAAQRPKLELSLLCLTAGDRPCADRWLERSFSEVTPARNDPWWAYVDGQAWLTGPRLAAFRESGMPR